MKITADDVTVGELLGQRFLVIPRFQRPYSWNRGEVEEFWIDTCTLREADYFIGSVVLYKSGSDELGIVDGQQRITTVTILLCALRDAFEDEGAGDLAKGLHQLIERIDITSRKRLVLRTQTSYPYLQVAIQSNDEEDEEEVFAASPEEELIQEAHLFLRNRIAEVVADAKRDAGKTVKSKKRAARQALETIRARVLSLNIIVALLENEEDAYLIFETLNTRGKNLSPVDLVRTHITRLIPPNNRTTDRPKERFEGILQRFAESDSELDPKDFLLHYWLSTHEYTSRARIFKEVKRTVKTKDAARKLLDSLETNGKLYLRIAEPDNYERNRSERPITRCLTSLNAVQFKQSTPFILSVVRSFEDKHLKLRRAVEALSAVENFHTIFSAVTSQPASGGISQMYALHARKLSQAKTDSGRDAAVDSLVEKLRQKLPVFEEFQANFEQVLFFRTKHRPKGTPKPQARLARYLLEKYTNHIASGVNLKASDLTVEHLLPQSAHRKSVPMSIIGQLGNLLLVTEELNEELGDKSFAEKAAILKSSHVPMDDLLTSFIESGRMSPSDVRARTAEMARVGYSTIWKL
ncbi:DUF262 domain-containing protein [Alienimonas chondri]|uniref:DUF262 domain-containing protein n=1 Tax=Alienimonas chondri TaxID=2681879 RepID=A0ABX1VIZ4_9PLAN|nr:DUF262 domain-containing protein [Alienimonas chondri]NNJ28045.1 hypothetical protein [Alienimonas chondri]